MDRYFQTLELTPDANWEDVKRSYRELAQVWHPDKHLNSTQSLQERAHKKLSEINEAYQNLDSFYKEQLRLKREQEERERKEREEQAKRAQEQRSEDTKRKAEKAWEEKEKANEVNLTYKPFEATLGDWIWFVFCLTTLIALLVAFFI